MKRVYVIYEKREEVFVEINDLQTDFDCIKIFNDRNQAINWFEFELNFQCDEIKYISEENEVIDYGENKDEFWLSIVNNTLDIMRADVYYCGEWQYSMYLKEMEVE